MSNLSLCIIHDVCGSLSTRIACNYICILNQLLTYFKQTMFSIIYISGKCKV